TASAVAWATTAVGAAAPAAPRPALRGVAWRLVLTRVMGTVPTECRRVRLGVEHVLGRVALGALDRRGASEVGIAPLRTPRRPSRLARTRLAAVSAWVLAVVRRAPPRARQRPGLGAARAQVADPPIPAPERAAATVRVVRLPRAVTGAVVPAHVAQVIRFVAFRRGIATTTRRLSPAGRRVPPPHDSSSPPSTSIRLPLLSSNFGSVTVSTPRS